MNTQQETQQHRTTHRRLPAALLATVAGAALSGLLLTGAGAHAEQAPAGTQQKSYTTFDHPSLPCNLSVEAVANWGETSAHLPLACTYDE